MWAAEVDEGHWGSQPLEPLVSKQEVGGGPQDKKQMGVAHLRCIQGLRKEAGDAPDAHVVNFVGFAVYAWSIPRGSQN